MRNLFLSAAAIASLFSASVVVGSAQARPQGRLIVAVDGGAAQPVLQDAQFLFGGRNYCWYVNGWRGPGFYWCGYAQRRGLGWGGGDGWNGWRSGGRGGHANVVRAGRATSVRSGGAQHSAVRAASARGGSHAGSARTASRGGGHKPGK